MALLRDTEAAKHSGSSNTHSNPTLSLTGCHRRRKAQDHMALKKLLPLAVYPLDCPVHHIGVKTPYSLCLLTSAGSKTKGVQALNETISRTFHTFLSIFQALAL